MYKTVFVVVLSVDRVGRLPHQNMHCNSNVTDFFASPSIVLLRQVRIVYFNSASTFNDDDFKARLGIQSFFAAPLQAAPRVKFTSAYHMHICTSMAAVVLQAFRMSRKSF